MQRASSTHTREVALTGIADLQVARKIFDYEEGAFKRTGAPGPINLQTGFSGILRDYQSKAAMRIPGVTYSGQAGYMYMQESDQNDPSGPNFDDPMDDIINRYREIGLRMSILEAVVNNQNVTSANTTISSPQQKAWISQTVDYISHQVRVEYKANAAALALAVVVSLLGPLATLTLFWGCWHLGRDFSMSPLELANAFLVRGPMLPMSSSSMQPQVVQDHYSRIQHQDQYNRQLATLLGNCSSNAPAKEITKHCARKRNDDRWWTTFFQSNTREPKLQYGVLESTGQLGFAVEDEQGVIHARKPREGEML
ncbi:hypothetical protein N0V85_008160 [Neurospora sp. IMI 360204]|nr:hypothetical protein N0V85_008160 [Neurospora sp. IMI 360204]